MSDDLPAKDLTHSLKLNALPKEVDEDEGIHENESSHKNRAKSKFLNKESVDSGTH